MLDALLKSIVQSAYSLIVQEVSMQNLATESILFVCRDATVACVAGGNTATSSPVGVIHTERLRADKAGQCCVWLAEL